jgi:hypothetical protein
MALFSCPYLGHEVELTLEREQHIVNTHPDFLPDYRDCLIETLANPDEIHLSKHSSTAVVFIRWYDSIYTGKYVAVVVETEVVTPIRDWVLTSYISRKMPKGDVVWKRN